MRKMKEIMLMLLVLVFIIHLSGREIIFVHEIIRHGARSPRIPIPNMNWDDWPRGPKMMTPIGLRQQFVMGRFLRDRYVEKYIETNNSTFLDIEYNPYQIFVRSTGEIRTVESALAQMMGLYGSTENELSETELNNSVPPLNLSLETKKVNDTLGNTSLPFGQYRLPIHVFNKTNDSYFRDVCPYADLMLRKEFLKSNEVKDILLNNSDVINKMLKAYGYDPIKVDFKTKISLISAVPLCNVNLKDCKLSSNVLNETLDLDRKIKHYKHAISTYYSQMISTPLIKELLLLYENAINTTINSTNKKDVLKGYFAFTHDTTMMRFAKALNITEILNSGIPCASSIIFELFAEDDKPKSKSDFSIVTYFNMEKFIIPGCSSDPCPYLEFEQALKKSILPNAESLCYTQIKK